VISGFVAVQFGNEHFALGRLPDLRQSGIPPARRKSNKPVFAGEWLSSHAISNDKCAAAFPLLQN
jgi:hypothetical protein